MAEPPIPESLTNPRGSTAAEVAQARFKGPTRPVWRPNVPVATTITPLLGNNPRRVFWMIMNRAVVNGAIGFDNELTAGTGILLAAAGGVATMDVEEDGEAVTYAVTGIMSGAAGAVTILEVERV